MPSLAAATLTPVHAPLPTETPLPPAPPTPAPVKGTTATQLNVRSGPATVADVLGILPPGTSVEIVGRDPAGNWWQILYPQGVDGKGWVTAQYVTAAEAAAVPVIGDDPGSGYVAVVQQQINIRSGPGTGFNSLGTLNTQDVVSLTGKDASGAWLQIVFAGGPDGKGWVNAGFVQAQGVEDLPIVGEAGQVIGTGTPTLIPPTPTRTLIPAPLDGDTAENPVVSVTFAPSGTHTLIYNGDVSAPTGDVEDWIRFVPSSNQVLVELSCSGAGLHIDLSGTLQMPPTGIACASRQVLLVEPGIPVQIHVQASGGGSQTYSSYTIKVRTLP